MTIERDLFGDWVFHGREQLDGVCEINLFKGLYKLSLLDALAELKTHYRVDRASMSFLF